MERTPKRDTEYSAAALLAESDPDREGSLRQDDLASALNLLPRLRVQSDQQIEHGTHESTPSPAPSLCSITESLLRAAFRTEFGRVIQNLSSIYYLPADDKECRRLEEQHLMFAWVLGKYPGPLVEMLAAPGDQRKAVLDLGCGTGAWLRDIAIDFPCVNAVGIDLIPPITLQRHMPTNIRFEVDDINLGLSHFFGQFDVVHARCISAGIKDYAGLVDQTARILRANGLLILSEVDLRVYNDNLKPYNLLASPAVAHYVADMRKCIRLRGGHVDAASLLHRWVSQHRSFTDIVAGDIYFPLSPFTVGETRELRRLRNIGLLARDNWIEYMESGRPLLLEGGLSADDVDRLLDAARTELANAHTPCYMRLLCVYARKRA